QEQNFDGLIVTGAPLGLVEFNDVAYWPQIKQVLEWSKDHVTSTLFVCWAVSDIIKLHQAQRRTGYNQTVKVLFL
ncbi:homoserine O-acetyltransferase/O-succinyltransferase family protein, partial [Escherichia sp. SS-MK2]